MNTPSITATDVTRYHQLCARHCRKTIVKQQSWLRDLIRCLCKLANLELDRYARVPSKWTLKQLFCRDVSFQYAFKMCTALSTLRTVLGSAREYWTASSYFLVAQLGCGLSYRRSYMQSFQPFSQSEAVPAASTTHQEAIANVITLRLESPKTPCRCRCDAPSAFRRHRPSHSTPWFLVTPHWVEHTGLWLEVKPLLTVCPHASKNTGR